MKKDIFIDNNVASKFSNPQDAEYIKLTKWLLHYDVNDFKNKNNYAHLVVSKKLLVEYLRSSRNAQNSTSIPIIINKLLQEDRLIIISNESIKLFQQNYFTKNNSKKLRSNHQDREFLPLVFLSDRKFALTYDENFIYDLNNFPQFSVFVRKRPEEIPYDKS
jgi:hypothetical protein